MIEELSSISARSLSSSANDDPTAVYTACGNMQLKLQQATALLQAYPRDGSPTR